MGLFGNRGLSAAQQVARGGDGVDPSTARPAFFGEGGTGRAMAGYIGDALLNMSGGKPVYAPMMQAHQQQQEELKRMMMLAQYKAQNPDPTGTMQNAVAAGYQPGTPGYHRIIQQTMLAPRIIATPGEGGTTDYRDFNQAGGDAEAPAAPQPGTVQGGYVFMGGDPANEASWRKQ